MKNVLVGYDGSPAAQAALELGADLARHYDARLHVLTVTQLPEIADDIETEALLERSQVTAEEVLDPIARRYADLDPVVTSHVGHPAEQILRYAEAHGVDHIVLGHRGRSLFERWLLGSVTRRVVAYAACTVTVARPAVTRSP